ncbi:right-handed parallel beta-helix repeat-containing protein [Planctomonas psychrotolerans]|uniref:right-handed parallel beta-helix repeat-containing protein n=1 Tax=Planctomonas psychrotolerans TaxID=2528712 RepID=UPI001239EC0B|nr:right-handed parallel beta-helix repeat-containing protein [Planctomonas psychrotolerans]
MRSVTKYKAFLANVLVATFVSGMFVAPMAMPDRVLAGTYENGSSAIALDGSWSTVSSGYDSGGSHSRMDSAGGAELSFTGTGVRWIARTNGYAGMADVYLDGTLVQTVDLYTKSAVYRSIVFDSGDLTPGDHTLRIERKGVKNTASTGTNIFLDSIVVNDAPVLSGVYENGSAPLVMSGPWFTVTSGSDSGGSHARISSAGAADLRFSGTSVRWTARTTSYAGIADVYIDGALAKSVDLYSATAGYRVVVFDSGPLERGEHSIRVQYTGNKNPASTGRNIFLDGIVVLDAPVEAGTYEDGDKAMTLTGSWSTVASGYDSGGSYGRLSGVGSAQLKFTGTSVRWISRTNNYAGMATVHVDGKQVATVDLYSATTAYRAVVFDSGTLVPGEHTIRIEPTGTRNSASTGAGVFLDSIVVKDTPVPEGTHENGTPSIVLGGPWYTVPSSYDSGGSHTRLDAPGTAELRFAGTSVRWISRTNSYAGTATVSIDGLRMATVDLYSKTAAYRATVFDSGPLDRGEHTLRIEYTGLKNPASTGKNIYLDSVVVADAPAAIGTHEDGSAVIAAAGSWSTVASGNDSGGSHARLSSSGSAQLKFDGTSVKWVSRTNDYAGIANVYVDGVKVRTVDLYSASPVFQAVVFDSGVLDPGEHTIRIERSGTRNPASTGTSIFLDAFVVSNALAAVITDAHASGTYDSESEAIAYSRTWRSVSSYLDYGGSYKVSGDGLASARFDFEGTGIRWVTRTNHYSGIAKVYLDGQYVRDVDLYTATRTDQNVVFERTGLAQGPHSLVIERTGAKSAASTGRDVSVDAFVVTDSTAPDAPAAPSLVPERKGIRVDWTPSPASDLTEYRLYRAGVNGSYSVLHTFPPAERSILDVGLTANAAYSYRLTAVDSSGNESAPSRVASAAAPAAAPVSAGRYASCPTATVRVSTNREFTAALAGATAGDVIVLAPGTYGANFDLTASGTAGKPIWICGSRSVVLDGGDHRAGYGFQLTGSSNVVLTGMSIRNVKKGVMVVKGSAVTVSDLSVSTIGEEAIHLRTNTTDSFVVGNTITRTGLHTPEYGEGVYVGTDPSNWCAFSACQPDRSNRNSVLSNVISATTAEGIEAKPGTEGGWLRGNTIDGSALNTAFAWSWISVSGNDYIVEGNVGTNSPEDGIKSVEVSTVPGWGRNNVFVANSATNVNGAFYGVRITTKGTGAIVGCDNTLSGAGAGVTNVPCQK